MKPTKPSAPEGMIEKDGGSYLPEGKSLRERLIEKGVGPGSTLKFILPKLPKRKV